MPAPRTIVQSTLGCLLLLTFCCTAAAQDRPSKGADGPVSVDLAAPPPLPAELIGKPVTKIDIVTAGGRWQVNERIRDTPLGQPLSPAYTRAIARELLSTGRYADARIAAYAHGAGAGLRITVVPRRVVAQVRVTGGGLEEALILEAAGVGPGDDITLAS